MFRIHSKRKLGFETPELCYLPRILILTFGANRDIFCIITFVKKGKTHQIAHFMKKQFGGPRLMALMQTTNGYF